MMLNPVKGALTLAIACSCFSAFAQQKAFVPFAPDAAVQAEVLTSLRTRFEKDISALDAKDRKQTGPIYKERYEMIVTRVVDEGVLTDAAARGYLDSIAGKIFTANPSLPLKDVRILFDRSYTVNAGSMGEGTIFLHTGLFHRLRNEAEAAFVLSHELAHYVLDHTNASINSYLRTINSPEFQKSLKTIKRTDYGQNSQLESLAKNLSFKNRRHGRAFEEAADSMALELLRNTGYDLGSSLSVLSMLDSSERDKYAPAPIEKQFHFAGYPFKPSWLHSDALSFSIAKTTKEQREADSLKTHPDCSARIARLRDKVSRYNTGDRKPYLVNEKKFAELKTAFDYDIIETSFNRKEVARALYYALQLLPLKGDDVYLHTMVGRCLNELYIAQKNHTLGKITELPGRAQEPGYNKLLNVIQNLRLQEIAAISYHFLQPWEARFAADRDFQQVWNTSKEHFNK